MLLSNVSCYKYLSVKYNYKYSTPTYHRHTITRRNMAGCSRQIYFLISFLHFTGLLSFRLKDKRFHLQLQSPHFLVHEVNITKGVHVN
jgi:hypothetical protein